MADKDYYRDNSSLKRPGIKHEFTQDQLEEYIKCSNDPIYFIKNYVNIISLDEGIIKFNMYSYQEEMVKAFHENRFSIVRIGRQSGKCAEYNTNITIRNKKTGEVKEIQIGQLFDDIKKIV